ncbi:MAG: phospholipase D-like domain-containing protein [Candidatus Dormibacteraceae bacterium]
MSRLLDRADQRLGHGLESLVVHHHRRRLARVGWRRALEAGTDPLGTDLWAAGEPPPRPGNAVEILVDGARALAAMAAEIRAARSHVHIAGWHVTPGFELTRRGVPTVLHRLLAETAERVPVRVLLWGGAPVPVFRPSRRDARAVRDTLRAGSAVQCALDVRERPMHCHHEKTIVIDDRVAFVGGIDLTNLAGDRYDESLHPARGSIGWHDLAARLRGPVVGDVAEHFHQRWRATTGEHLPPPAASEAAGSVEVQLVRTVPDGMYEQWPRGDFRILEAYLRALGSATRLIYLENQFLWSPEILAVLRHKLRHPPTSGFRLVIVLPAKPNSGADDTRGQLGTLLEADGGGGRLLACALRAHGAQADQIYVHAKIGVVDDRWMTLGSANLNEHSLFNDTEVNVLLRDEGLIRRTRERLWAEHLELGADEVGRDPTAVVDTLWRPIAEEQSRRRGRGEAPTHRLVTLPGLSRRSGLLLGPLQGLLVDG